jgi:AraC family transcriptional regulator
MQPVIQQALPKKLIGMRVRTSRSTFQPYELWRKFMPEKKQIGHVVDDLLYSMQVYEEGIDVKPTTEFDQWAAVEVSTCESKPDGMETYDLAGGLYATFIHKGMAKDFLKTIQYIHAVWLPASKYEIDNREHFERLGSKYDRTSADSEEEAWVPIKLQKA